jgi:formylglycine-generating enzyme required for sulfatase activity
MVKLPLSMGRSSFQLLQVFRSPGVVLFVYHVFDLLSLEGNGVEEAKFTWGDEHFPDGKAMANTWQSDFPWQNLLLDGHEGTSPVGAFPANGYGLHDMAGNVWEWTADWYVPRHADEVVKPCCGPLVNPRIVSPEKSYDPAQPQFRIPRKVVKGGSFLCAPNYCLRYRPAARQPQMIDTGMSHIGFRCIVRSEQTSAV